MSPVLHVTVAAIARAGDRYLLVDEIVKGERVVNQPAGHWEPNETLLEAVARETLEETGWEFAPRGLIGVYQWAHPGGRDTFLRFAFHGEAVRWVSDQLDAEIQRVLWWTEQEIRASTLPLRSPQVLRAIEDFQNGAHYPLDCLKQIR